MSNGTYDDVGRSVFGTYWPYVKEVLDSTTAFLVIVFLLWLCRQAVGFLFPPIPGDILSTVLHIVDAVAAIATVLGWFTFAMLGIGRVWICINVNGELWFCKQAQE